LHYTAQISKVGSLYFKSNVLFGLMKVLDYLNRLIFRSWFQSAIHSTPLINYVLIRRRTIVLWCRDKASKIFGGWILGCVGSISGFHWMWA